ncbi:MAG: hypothetical protein R6V83_02755 [Candidatus Thorarchaeota archaeon]
MVTQNSMLALSFLCPFMFIVQKSGPKSEGSLMAPLWAFDMERGFMVGGPTFFALIAFYLWLPYVCRI